MTTNQFTPKKSVKRFIPHAVVGLVFLGVGSMLGTTTEVPVEVEKIVEVAGPAVPEVPHECIAALDDADEEFVKAADAFGHIGNLFSSIDALDFEAVASGAEAVEKAVGKIGNTDYRANADACRSIADRINAER